MENKKSITFYVAGVKFHGLHRVINHVQVGDDVALIPEPNNEYDENAVRIKWEGVMIGYVPKKYSRQVSLWLTGDVIAYVSNINPDSKTWKQIEIYIEVNDES